MRQWWIRGVAYCEMIGGILVLAGGWSHRHDALGKAFVSFPIITLVASALAITAGAMLLAGKPLGLATCQLVQGLQIVKLNPGARYVLLVGPEITLLLSSVGARIAAGAGGAFAFIVPSPDGSLGAPACTARCMWVGCRTICVRRRGRSVSIS